MFSFLRRSPDAARVRPLAAAEAVARAQAGELTLIDVRSASEIAAFGRAEGALHVPLALVRAKCDPAAPDCPKGLEPGRPVALYCTSGGRSRHAAQQLIALGYTEVYNLGGLSDWRAAGGRVTR